MKDEKQRSYAGTRFAYIKGPFEGIEEVLEYGCMSSSPLSIAWLRVSYPFMGKHSGYEPLISTLESAWRGKSYSIRMRQDIVPIAVRNLLKPLIKALHSSNNPTSALTSPFTLLAELQCRMLGRLKRPDILHIMNLEMFLGMLKRGRPAGYRHVIAVAHMPASWWREQGALHSLIPNLDAVVVLCQEQARFFEEFIPGRVHYIRYAIDHQFFAPAETKGKRGPVHCVFAGFWLRDLPGLVKIVQELLAVTDIEFDLVVPRDKRDPAIFGALLKKTRLHWHAGLSCEHLREVYRNAELLMLPLRDSGANTALLEAMACGLPVVVTDIGGVRDYTDPSFADLVPPGDIRGFASAVQIRLADLDLCRERGRAARKFVETNLTWESAARKTLELYSSLTGISN